MRPNFPPANVNLLLAVWNNDCESFLFSRFTVGISEFSKKGLAQGKSSVHTFLLSLLFNTLKKFLNLRCSRKR